MNRKIMTVVGIVTSLAFCSGPMCMPTSVTSPSPGHVVDPADTSDCVDFDLIEADTLQPSVVKLYFQLTSCNGDPVSDVSATQFRIFEDGQEVSVFESDQDFVPEPQPFQLITVLLLDMSGSILESGNLPALQQAAKTFVRQVAENQPIAIYTFDGRADLQLLTAATNSIMTLSTDIDGLSGYDVVDESTNLNGAVVAGLNAVDEEIDAFSITSLKAGTLVVFTDGTDQAARVSDDSAVRQVENSSHSIYAIGLGGEIDSGHLARIGKNGSYVANNVTNLEGVFQEAGNRIREVANSFYVLAYCSPKRAGKHTLELTLDENTGSVTYTFDASTFEGGCSPEDFLNEETPQPTSTPEPIECNNDDCNDGLFCNGEEICRGGVCSDGTPPCDLDQECAEGSSGPVCINTTVAPTNFTLYQDNVTGTTGNDFFEAPLYFTEGVGKMNPTLQTGDRATGLAGYDHLHAVYNSDSTVVPILAGIEEVSIEFIGLGILTFNAANVTGCEVYRIVDSIGEVVIICPGGDEASCLVNQDGDSLCTCDTSP